MILNRIILDTGPLVAFLNKNDNYHDWVVTQLNNVKSPVYTCEAVISEAAFLLRHCTQGQNAVLEMIKRGFIKISFNLQNELESIQKLMKKYSSVPMSLADACLVRMSEFHKESTILTLDADFRIYRRNRVNVIPVILPKDRSQ